MKTNRRHELKRAKEKKILARLDSKQQLARKKIIQARVKRKEAIQREASRVARERKVNKI